MDLPKGTEYSFHQLYLYPAEDPVKETAIPQGKVEIVVNGAKGWLKWYLNIGTGTKPDSGEYLTILLSNESTGQAFRIARFPAGHPGVERGRWEFNTVPAVFRNSPGLVKYTVEIIAGDRPDNEDSQTVNGIPEGKVILEGVVMLSGEVNDNRVIGFNREVKTTKSAPNCQGNPLFQPVQPFKPPLPNIRWWQISIMPDLENNYSQPAFCPKRKKRVAF